MGTAAGLVSQQDGTTVIAAGVISMFLTPLLVRIAPHVSAGERLLRPLEKLLHVRSIDEAPDPEIVSPRGKHVIVVGYGLAGRLLAGALARREVPHVVLELNAETVRQAHARGEPVYYGDASSPEALEHAHLREAGALVALMNDAAALERVIVTARRLAPELPILVRTRYLARRAALVTLGATDAVAEEVEGGVEVLARVLRRLSLPRNLIDEEIHHARSATQPSERVQTLPRQRFAETDLAELRVESVLIRAGSAAEGRTLAELDLRRRTQSQAIALRRAGALIEDIDPESRLVADDLLFLAGRSQAIRAAMALLDAPAMRDGVGD
jgi:CPA2 family monovalent cation:H+ antiporter-2